MTLSFAAQKIQQGYDFDAVASKVIPKSLQAIGDISLRMADLGIREGDSEPMCFQGKTSEGRLATLYTREVIKGPKSGREIFRRIILGEYGSDVDGQYMETTDLLISLDQQAARLRSSIVRPTEHERWLLSEVGNPIPCPTTDPGV